MSERSSVGSRERETFTAGAWPLMCFVGDGKDGRLKRLIQQLCRFRLPLRVRSALASVRRLPGRWRHGGLGALRFERNQLQQRRVLHADRHGGSLLIRDAAGYGSPEEALRQPRIDLRAPARRRRLVLLRRREVPVHRCVLAAGSPFFGAAFAGSESGARLELAEVFGVNLLTWSETPPPHDSVAPGSASSLSNSRSHQEDAENQGLPDKKAAPMLAHYCSIITSLEFSPDGRFIVSADRIIKFVLLWFPRIHWMGLTRYKLVAWVILNMYPALTSFVPQIIHMGLVSGSGDSTVRLWDVTLGSLLDTCEIGAKAELSATDGIEEEPCHAVTDLCTCPNGTSIALAVQSLKGVMLLNCDLSAKTLSIAKVILIEGETLIPTSLGTSLSEGLL
ncbi:hypothetical protein NL676_039795 [Syzygium grande]|nr:hypothetical protein NL676_039795 [Syzygium grande]